MGEQEPGYKVGWGYALDRYIDKQNNLANSRKRSEEIKESMNDPKISREGLNFKIYHLNKEEKNRNAILDGVAPILGLHPPPPPPPPPVSGGRKNRSKTKRNNKRIKRIRNKYNKRTKNRRYKSKKKYK